ncbi:MAG: hypothetical protein GWP06_04395 [Actinobacteria bacterium]|nr:hypothetical protein [Actinomycetota bacterium]
MRRRQIYNLFFILIFASFWNCGELDRNNPLDPKNPNSQAKRVVIVEAFVNSSAGAPVNAALEGLDRLAQEFSERSLICLEHHIEKTEGTDPWATGESYTRYGTLSSHPGGQGLPDVFFDGSEGRVQGASDSESVYQRYRKAFEQRASHPAGMTIEPSARVDGNKIKVIATIARLGNTEINDVVLSAIVAENMGGNHRNVVRTIVPFDPIGTMQAGTTQEAELYIPVAADWDLNKIVIVVVAQNSRTLEIYHGAQAGLVL